MKINVLPYLLAIFLSVSLGLNAQGKKSKPATATRNYPASFVISKAEFDNLFSYKKSEAVSTPSNKYLNKAVLQMNSLNGDMKFLKLKLDYFKNAFLLVQVNGAYTTQVFVLSDDKSVFYKGTIEKGTVTMSKCSEDDIVSE